MIALPLNPHCSNLSVYMCDDNEASALPSARAVK